MIDAHRRAARRGRGGDRDGRLDRRARGAARALPRPQGRAARTCCAASPQLPPEQRGHGRQAPPTRRARRSRRSSRRARGELEAGELDARLAADRVDVTLPGEPPQPVGRLHLLTADPARDRGRLRRPGLHRRRGPRGRDRPLQLRRAQPRPDAPGARSHRHVLRRPTTSVLRTHTSPMQIRAMEAHPPPLYVVIPGRAYRRDSRRDAHAAVPPGRGPGRRRGHHARRPQGHAAGVRARDLRRRPRGAPAPALLPVHRAARSRSTCRASTARQGFLRDGSRCRSARARAGSRSSAPARSTPTSSTTSRRRLRPREGPGLRLGDGHRAHRDAQARRPRPAPLLRERPALPGAVRMRVPVEWLSEYADAGLPVGALEERLTHDRHEGRGRPPPRRRRARALRRRPGARGRPAPRRRPAQRLPGRRGRRRPAADRLRRAERRRRARPSPSRGRAP